MYRIEEAQGKQKLAILLVVKTLKQWIEHSNDPRTHAFKPLRLTVRGMGGTGKSFFIHVLSTVCRQVFQTNTVDMKVAPTGTAAFNIGGETCHSAFCISVNDSKQSLPTTKERQLQERLRRTLLIMVDERSLLSSEVVGAMECNVSKTAHGGGHYDEDWGGVPVVIFLGDDYQIPPVRIMGKGRGAFQITSSKDITRRYTEMEQNGNGVFLSMAENVITFDQNLRVSGEDRHFRDILCRLRVDNQTDADANTILKLDVNRLTQDKRKELENSPTTIHLFAFNHDRIELNMHKLCAMSNTTNPVAIIKARVVQFTTNTKRKNVSEFKHFKDNNLPRAATICRGCKVAIKGKNFNPEWGLFNGAIGTVQEIVYKNNESPNEGHLPCYVAVEFPSYTGYLQANGSHVWDENNPQVIPIPIVTARCKKGCCQIEYLPLELAFGKSIHTFQGLEAGPHKPIQTIIVDCGTILFECSNPGLLYTTIARASTIGENGINDSAIYFQNLQKSRYMYTANSKNQDKQSQIIKDRQSWIEYLNKNEVTYEFTGEEENELINWTKTQVSHRILMNCIDQTSWRIKLTK